MVKRKDRNWEDSWLRVGENIQRLRHIFRIPAEEMNEDQIKVWEVVANKTLSEVIALKREGKRKL